MKLTQVCLSLFASVICLSNVASADPTLDTRCFKINKEESGLIQSYVAESCEEIGDPVPYFSLGTLVSPETLYTGAGELDCHEKATGDLCRKCVRNWWKRSRQILSDMTRNKMITSQFRGWMVSALSGYYQELKNTCPE